MLLRRRASGLIACLLPSIIPRIEAGRHGFLKCRDLIDLRYLAYLAQKHRAFEITLLSAIPTAQIILRLRMSLNGTSVLIPEYLIEAVRRLPAVKAVYPDTVRHPATERSPAFIGAAQTWQQPGGGTCR